ncbi:MAG: hypothetical protein ACHQ7M_05420 [Chloroflexota bacterium]
MTVKEVESLVFLAARSHPQFEAAQRTWLEDDRGYFIRWREAHDGAPLRIIGLVHAFQLPEMACRVELVSFDDEPAPALQEYADMLRKELATEGFT